MIWRQVEAELAARGNEPGRRRQIRGRAESRVSRHCGTAREAWADSGQDRRAERDYHQPGRGRASAGRPGAAIPRSGKAGGRLSTSTIRRRWPNCAFRCSRTKSSISWPNWFRWRTRPSRLEILYLDPDEAEEKTKAGGRSRSCGAGGSRFRGGRNRFRRATWVKLTGSLPTYFRSPYQRHPDDR